MSDIPEPVAPPASQQDNAASPALIKADLLAGLFFVVLGVAILYGSWTMDRLEIRRIHPLTAPGLVPGLLSVALTVCGLILALRSLRRPAPDGWSDLRGAVFSEAARRALAVAALALAYTLGLVGLIPFWAATGIFVFAFIMIFECWLAAPRRPVLAALLWAVALAMATGAAVTLVFERAFLVRLP